MKTSVIIPCYNCSNHIDLVISHLTNQTRHFDEIIVVDDCSTDDTGTILSSLPVQVLTHNKNQGPAAARNTGAKSASCDILIFIDSDAYAFPDLNEKILNSFSNNSIDKKFAGVGGQGIEREILNIYDKWRITHNAQNFGISPKKDVPYLFGLCCSYRREVFEKVGGFDQYFRKNAGEDFDIGLRIRKYGYRLAYDPEIRVHHHHKDTRESLLRVQYNWSYWSYLSILRTKHSTLKFILGPYWRLISYSIKDLLNRRFDLVGINFDVFIAKQNGIYDAQKNYKRM